MIIFFKLITLISGLKSVYYQSPVLYLQKIKKSNEKGKLDIFLLYKWFK